MSLARYVKRIFAENYAALPKMAKRDEDNREVLDPVPVAPPVGWFKQPSMFDQVRDMVRSEHMRMWAAAQGSETFEEANDFEVADELFPGSEHEGDFEPVADLQARRQAEFREEFLREREERYMKRKRKEWISEDTADAASPPEPRPSPKPGAGDGGLAKPAGERSDLR